jgi:hypothetical protein
LQHSRGRAEEEIGHGVNVRRRHLVLRVGGVEQLADPADEYVFAAQASQLRLDGAE